jgi:peptidoglycan hydrolase-like protein with peptidoglycan-binding domain
VFLGPGGAQYNMPQMYWWDIGTSVANVYSHTYLFNRPYLRPISPLGQVYGGTPVSQIRAFRQYYQLYAGVGISWWDWQDATTADWKAVSGWVPNLAKTSAVSGEATIENGWAGDIVVWAQEHLVAAGYKIAIDGGFGPKTKSAVKKFQAAHGLPATGVINTQTWWALFRYKPYAVKWTKAGTTNRARIAAARHRLTPSEVAAADTGSAARPSANGTAPVPESALLPSTHNEISGTPGAGRP